MKYQKRSWVKKIFSKSLSQGKPDYVLIVVVFLIVVFGLLILSSASSVIGYQKFSDSYYFLKHQILRGLLPGLVLLIIFSRINYQYLKKFKWPFLIFSVVILILVFIPGLGESYGRAKSWLNFRIFSFQPAEVVKLTILLFLASWLGEKSQEEIKNFWSTFIPFALILGTTAILVVFQPDIGTMSVIVLVAVAVYFVSGGKITHLIFLGLLGAGGLTILILQATYRVERLITFFNPAFEPQGVSYHINQAYLAIGSGGWLGRGFGQSLQKFAYLPEVTGDSIFAIIAEELGFFVSVGLIILFLILLFRGIKISQFASDRFGRLLAFGITFWFICQAFLNIAAMIGLIPLTGVPLPFVSYGGTALAVSLAAVGVLINISKTISR